MEVVPEMSIMVFELIMMTEPASELMEKSLPVPVLPVHEQLMNVPEPLSPMRAAPPPCSKIKEKERKKQRDCIYRINVKKALP